MKTANTQTTTARIATAAAKAWAESIKWTADAKAREAAMETTAADVARNIADAKAEADAKAREAARDAKATADALTEVVILATDAEAVAFSHAADTEAAKRWPRRYAGIAAAIHDLCDTLAEAEAKATEGAAARVDELDDAASAAYEAIAARVYTPADLIALDDGGRALERAARHIARAMVRGRLCIVSGVNRSTMARTDRAIARAATKAAKAATKAAKAEADEAKRAAIAARAAERAAVADVATKAAEALDAKGGRVYVARGGAEHLRMILGQFSAPTADTEAADLTQTAALALVEAVADGLDTEAARKAARDAVARAIDSESHSHRATTSAELVDESGRVVGVEVRAVRRRVTFASYEALVETYSKRADADDPGHVRGGMPGRPTEARQDRLDDRADTHARLMAARAEAAKVWAYSGLLSPAACNYLRDLEDGQSMARIAAAYGVSKGTVAQTIARAYKRIAAADAEGAAAVDMFRRVRQAEADEAKRAAAEAVRAAKLDA